MGDEEEIIKLKRKVTIDFLKKRNFKEEFFDKIIRKQTSIKISNKEESTILLELLFDLGLKWDNGNAYIGARSNGDLFYRRRLGEMGYGNYFGRSHPRYIYPLLGKITKTRLKGTTQDSITLKDFLKEASKFLISK